ncbi:MAG TPA: hypothetical protein VM101_14225 [Flavitalea sp.]|nr:hypothetical protein [Flavitalea sp.]
MKKLWSEFKYWLVIFLFLAILFELVASMILFRKYTTDKLAILHYTASLFKNGAGQKMYAMHSAARPRASEEVNKQIADESKEADQYSYEPWVMFRMANYHSDYVNVNGFERRSTPDALIKNGDSNTINIYFFGGDNMYGYNLADNETIPSQFVKAYNEGNPGRSVAVKNFGISHYYSKQELMLLSSLLFEGKRPDIVIFLDGLNDFYLSRMLYYDKPYFSYALQQSFEGKMFQNGKHSFLDSTSQLYNDADAISASQYNDELIKKYKKNIKMAMLLCKNAGIKSYFFCEPVPFYKNAYSGTSYKGNFKRFESIYRELEKTSDSTGNFYFLGNMTADQKASGFTDGLNYTPAFSEKVARLILSTVKKDLR